MNELSFGNASRKNLIHINTENYLDSLLSELKNYPYPANDSEAAKKEINDLVAATQQLSISPEFEKRFVVYDNGFENYIINSLVKVGVPADEVTAIVKSLHDDISPLLMKLKYFYQRVRPQQLAYLLGIYTLNPYDSVSANTPAYPSGHALLSKVYAEVLGNKYPKYYKALTELATDIMWSRIYMGLHYTSDCNFSTYISETICNHLEFKRKYSL